MRDALRALSAGLSAVLRSPILVGVVCLITIVAALPFGLVLGDRLRTALANQPSISLEATEIDAEWWMHFRARARGLDRTFTPAVLGFAAPLDNLSALMDGSPRPLIIAVPVAIYALVWAFLWGGVLTRFDRGGALGTRGFIAAGRRHFPLFTLIGLAAATVTVMLYLTVHTVLFGPVYRVLASTVSSERDAFLWRVALYVVFASLLAAVSLAADYARVSAVCAGARSAREAIASGLRFMRTNPAAVATLYLATGALFVALFVLYGIADRRFGGWRGVLLGQAFIFGRLAIRLTFGASEIALFKQRADAAHPHSTSRGTANPGPPAAT